MSTNPNPVTNAADPAPRCQHRFANFKQCRLPASAASTFCLHHAKLAQSVEEDHSFLLLKSSQDFQTAQGVNFALANLFELVAKNRISPRRAAVLAHIGGLLLRTHSAIDHDRKLNIADPTRDKSKQTLPPMPEPDHGRKAS